MKHCPKCQSEHLFIDATMPVVVELAINQAGIPEITDTKPTAGAEWTDDSLVICSKCGWKGKIIDLTGNAARECRFCGGDHLCGACKAPLHASTIPEDHKAHWRERQQP